MDEVLDLVNADDLVIGQVKRQFIYENNLHNYRVVGIFLLDSKFNLLVPTRSISCSIYPGCFDFSVAGHVLHGESYVAAAIREAEEELGVPKGSLELNEFLYAPYPNNYGLSSFCKYFYAFYNSDLLINKSIEVADYKFMMLDEVKLLIQEQPDKFKSDYIPVFHHFIKKIGSIVNGINI